MTINRAGDIGAEWAARSMTYAADHHLMDTMVEVYEGGIPQEFKDFFHEEQHVHLINSIRLSWDDLANLAGKVFPVYVNPDDDSSKAKDRAERLEKIAYGWNDAGRAAGGVSMKMLMKVIMWWLVGCANAVAMTLPDYRNKSPFFTWRDPRTHYPPVGWTPWNETRADDALFAYQKTVAQLKAEYPDKADEIGRAVRRIYNLGALPGGGSQGEDETWMWVGEYYHEDTWMVTTLAEREVTLVRSDAGDRGHPGVQPVVAMSLYSATGPKGRSMFADQISIQAAMARMFSQKLDFFDRTLYPIIFTTPLAGQTVKIGPFAVNEWDITMNVPPKVDTIAPAAQVDADQTLAFAMSLSRMLNRNPESLQGQGEANSAKALSKLMEGVNQTIREGVWPSVIEAMPQLYAAAAKMEVNLWGDTRKFASGTRANTSFRLEYRPRLYLPGREHTFQIEPGVGLAGYQGTLEILQLVGAELMSEDTALEQGEWAREPQEEKRRIQGGRMEKLIWADLQAKAAQGMLQPGAMGRLREMVFAKGEDLFDALRKLEEMGALMVQPMMPEEMGLPMGGPPEAGAGLPPPSLEALRGGR